MEKSYKGENSWKNQQISFEFLKQTSPKSNQKILLEIDRFCPDQTSVCNIFLTEVIIILLFQQQHAPEMNQWQSLNSAAGKAVNT